MSTLNTFGFNVRRKRNQEAHSPLPSKQDKVSSTPILAFAAPALPSSYHISKPPINKNNTKSKTSKQHLPKDPKQSTLLPFFTTTQLPSSSPLPSTPLSTDNDTTVKQYSPPLRTETPSLTTLQDQQSDNEDNEICLVRRHVTMNELLPMLMDTFGEYGNDDLLWDRLRHENQQRTRLLQVKPNKMVHTIQLEAMDLTTTTDEDLTSTPPPRQRRRRSCHEMNEDDEDLATDTLRTAFTKLLSLVPVKKRLCGKPLTKSLERQQQHETISTLFENGHEQHLYALEDEFSNQQEDKEFPMVRRCLSPGQVNTLLLDIANEYLVFDNNTWCTSYIGL